MLWSVLQDLPWKRHDLDDNESLSDDETRAQNEARREADEKRAEQK